MNSDNRILSVGSNGAPNGLDDDIISWNCTGNSTLETKYPYVCHA